MRVPQRLRDRQRGAIRDRPLDRILQHRSPAFDARRQDARRGLCYASTRGEIGGVIKPRIHLSQAAILSRKSGPPHSYEPPHAYSRSGWWKTGGWTVFPTEVLKYFYYRARSLGI